MDIAAAVDSTTSLLSLAWSLVNAVLEARGEVTNARENTNKLLDTVEKAQSSLRHLQNSFDGQPLWDGLDDHLRKLSEELCLAVAKVQKSVTSNKRREAGNQLVATARSVIGRGATQQNKETLSIIQRLEVVLADLDREVLYFIGRTVANCRARPVAAGSVPSLPPASPLPHPEHALVTKMLTLATKVDETLTVEVAVSQGDSWIDPDPSSQTKKAQEAVKKSDLRSWLHGRKRDAREGGYEVPSSTKVRFSMSVSYGQWHFYVLTFDSWASAEPRVFFPKLSANVINLVSSESKKSKIRVFPSKKLHPQDPISLKVERSTLVPDDVEGQVSIFLVLTATPLKKDDAHARKNITIQDMERHMDSFKDDGLIVRHIPFDIKKMIARRD